MREQRRLTAIVAADVVGYSRLMGRDESSALARLQAVLTKPWPVAHC
jgi:class 3 adenylate cyclase